MAPRTAGFFIRAVAYVVDAFLLSLVGGAFPYLVVTTNNGRSAGAAGGSLVLSFIYFVLLWSDLGHGRTAGMWLLGLRVVREDGRPIGVGDAIVRWVGLWLSFVVCFVGVIWVAFDGRHQGWHDKIAHTLVVHV